jgi:pimeloyl-ACP methyl ester carboxylesterase
VELLPAAGHNLHLDEPGAVREAVARFLSDLERKELVA